MSTNIKNSDPYYLSSSKISIGCLLIFGFLGVIAAKYVKIVFFFKQGLQLAKSIGILTVKATVLQQNSVVSILLHPAVSEMIFFNHDVEASPITIFFNNPDIDNTGDAIPVLSWGSAAISPLHWVVSLPIN